MNIWWYGDQRCFFSDFFKTPQKWGLHNVPFWMKYMTMWYYIAPLYYIITTISIMMVIVIIADVQVLLMNLSIWDSGIGLINVSRAFPELW